MLRGVCIQKRRCKIKQNYRFFYEIFILNYFLLEVDNWSAPTNFCSSYFSRHVPTSKSKQGCKIYRAIIEAYAEKHEEVV